MTTRAKAGAKASAKDKPKKERKRLNLGAAQEMLKRGGERVDFYRFDAPETRAAFLMNPPPSNDVFYYYRRALFIPKPDGETKRFFISPRTEHPDKYCPVERAIRALKVHPAEEMRALASEIRPSDQFLSNALVREGTKWDMQQVQYGWRIFRRLVNTVAADLEEGEQDVEGFIDGFGVFDPEAPRIVMVTVEGKGRQKQYDATVTAKTVPEDVLEGLMEKRMDLSEYVVPSPAEEIERAVCEYIGIQDLSELESETEGDREPEKNVEEKPGDDKPQDEDRTASVPPVPEECIGKYSKAKRAERECDECLYEASCKAIKAEDD